MSFSAEMKDFLNAYQTTQKVNASKTDQDYRAAQTEAQKKETEQKYSPEQLEYEDKMQQLKLKAAQRTLGSGALRDQLVRQRMQQEKAYFDANRPGGTNNIGDAGLTGSGPQTPSPASTGAVPAGNLPQPEIMDAGGGMIPDRPVRAYQGGGAVPVADDEEAETTPDSEAAETGAVPTGTATDFSARRRGGIDGIISPQLVSDAVLAGQTRRAQDYGLHTPPGAVRSRSQAAIARAYYEAHHSGVTPQEMEVMKKRVDPNNELTESQRNMKALGTVYEHFANKGEPEKASRAAAQFLQYYQNATQRYAAIAAHAVQGGDMDLATKALVKSYQNVPDGNDATIEKNPDGGYFVHVTGPDGKSIIQQIATPQQLGQFATGLAADGFDKALLHAAGVQEQAKAPVKAAPMSKASDRLNMEKLVGGHVDKFVSDWNDKSAKEGKTPEEKAVVPSEYVAELHGATQGLMQHNPELNGAQAVRAAHMLLQPGSKDPEKMDFKIIEGKEGEDPTVDFGGKFKAKVPQELLSNFENSRAARIKAETDKISKTMEESDKPSIGSRVSELGGAIKDVPKGSFGSLEEERAARRAAAGLPAAPPREPDKPWFTPGQPGTGVLPIDPYTMLPTQQPPG